MHQDYATVEDVRPFAKSRVEISHTGMELAQLAWLWARVVAVVMVLATLIERHDKLILLAVSVLILWGIYWITWNTNY